MATVFSYLNHGETLKNFDRMFPFGESVGYKHQIGWFVAGMIPGISSNYEYLELIYRLVFQGWDVSSSEVIKSIFDILVLRGDLIEESAMWLHEHRFVLESGSDSLRL